MTYGEYTVTGRRSYRGHPPGSTFEASLNPLAAARAIQRGDIRLLREITPTVPDGAELPDGWLPPSVPPQANHEAPPGASLVSEGG